jgi:hypothetical protein
MYTDIVEIIKSWPIIVQFIFFSIVVFSILAIVGMIVHSLAEFFNKTLIFMNSISFRRSLTCCSLFISFKFFNYLFVDSSHWLNLSLLYIYSLIELVVFVLVYDCTIGFWYLFWAGVFIRSYLKNMRRRSRNLLLYWRITFRFRWCQILLKGRLDIIKPFAYLLIYYYWILFSIVLSDT